MIKANILTPAGRKEIDILLDLELDPDVILTVSVEGFFTVELDNDYTNELLTTCLDAVSKNADLSLSIEEVGVVEIELPEVISLANHILDIQTAGMMDGISKEDTVDYAKEIISSVVSSKK